MRKRGVVPLTSSLVMIRPRLGDCSQTFYQWGTRAKKQFVRFFRKWYIEEGYGGSKIAKYVNERGIKTKRAVITGARTLFCRIPTNEMYTGKIINGKEESCRFSDQSERGEKDESEWLGYDSTGTSDYWGE